MNKIQNAQIISEYFVALATEHENTCRADDNKGLADQFMVWKASVIPEGIALGTARSINAISQIIRYGERV